MVATLFLSCLCTAIILTPIGFLRKSWVELLVAAGLSMVVVVLTIFSIGGIVFALTCLNLFAAVALRLNAGWQGWLVAMTGALFVWSPLVLVPRHAPDTEPWAFFTTAIPLVGLAVAVVFLIVGRYDRRTLTPNS